MTPDPIAAGKDERERQQDRDDLKKLLVTLINENHPPEFLAHCILYAGFTRGRQAEEGFDPQADALRHEKRAEKYRAECADHYRRAEAYRVALDRIANGVGVKHRDAQRIAREALDRLHAANLHAQPGAAAEGADIVSALTTQCEERLQGWRKAEKERDLLAQYNHEARCQLQAVRAECARLKAERASFQSVATQKINNLERGARTVESEAERLRKALNAIAEIAGAYSSRDDIRDMATAALARNEPGEGTTDER